MAMYFGSKQDKYNDSPTILGIVRKLLARRIQHKNNGHVDIATREDIAKLVFCEVFFLVRGEISDFFLFASAYVINRLVA